MPLRCRSADDRADQLLADHLELAEVRLGQRVDNRARVLVEGVLLLVNDLRQANLLLVLRRIAVGLDHLLARDGRHQRVANLIVRHRLLELHDDDGAAREIDAERNAALQPVH
jgi:hypothetical protein